MNMTEIFVLAGILIQVGIYLQTSRSNTKAIDALTTEQVAQGKDISKIKGFLGINGDGYPRGKGHHV
jgi:hypothetical protein